MARPQLLMTGLPGRIMRWGWLGGPVVAIVLIAVLVGPKAQTKTDPGTRDEVRVLAADAALGGALRAGNRAAARRLLSLQFTFVDATGKIHARKEFLSDLSAVAAAPASDAKARSYGLVTMVTGHRKSVQAGEVFFLDVWAKQKRAWRVLVMQDVILAPAAVPTVTATPTVPAVPAAPATLPAAPAKPDECKNPCQVVPYRVRSPAEQDIINAFQAIAKAIVAHDADEWAKHVADEFVLYGSHHAPVPKSERIATIERQKQSGAAVAMGEVQAMRLSVYGDGAAMIVTDAPPDKSHPPYRATRVWVKRNGRWLMAISAHTEIK